MKKFIFTMALLFSALVTINAQTALSESKFVDNMYVGINGGISTPLSFDKAMPLNPLASIRIGKDFTPIFGMNVEGTAWFGSNSNRVWLNGLQGERILLTNRFDTPTGVHNVFRGVNVGVNGTINLTNLFLGYNGEPRNFEVITQTGLGWGHVFVPSSVGSDMNNLTAKTGVDFAFNLGENKAHSVYVEPAVLWNLNGTGYSGIQFNKNRAQLAVVVGYNYRFMTSNGTHNFVKYDVGALNDAINQLRAENAELAKRPKVVERIIKENVGTTVINPYIVRFAFGGASLTGTAKQTLDEIPSDATVDVSGFASFEKPKDEKFNKTLSETRAQMVAQYLAQRGIKVRNVNGFGAVEDSQREAIVTLVK